MGRWTGAAAVASATVAGGVLALLVAQPRAWAAPMPPGVRVLVFVGGAWLVFVVGVLLVRRLAPRPAVALILVGGVVLPLAAGFAPPRSSDDLYRYIWDGRVQAAGIDPYRYVPAAAELVGLRDEFLWPRNSAWCVVAGDTVPDGHVVPGCTLINRPLAHTIYPPVAQAYFLGVHAVSPPGTRHVPVQLAASALAAATTVLLLVAMRARRADPRHAVLWAWCPGVAVEAGSNAHVDVLAVFLTGLGVVALARARDRRGTAVGAALVGLAVATKLTPAVVGPALLRRHPVTVALAAAGTVVAVYVPHVLDVGTAVVGHLPGYLAEEGFDDGSRFALLSWLVPARIGGVVAIGILVVAAVRVALTADPGRPWLGAATMTGTALLVAGPAYPWYALLLVMLVGLGARPEWLAVVAAGYVAQYAAELSLTPAEAQRLGYGAALVVVVTGAVVRRRRSPTVAEFSVP
jgi:hypothetical protein